MTGAVIVHRVPTERSFGLSVGSVLVVLAGVSLWRGNTTAAAVLAAVGSALVSAALIAPTALRMPNHLWWRFAQTLGWVNTRILLTLFFFVILTPVGVVRRAAGRHPLKPQAKDTGWSPYVSRRRDPKHYEHQF